MDRDFALWIVYARAHVSLNAKDAHNWADSEVINAFYMLPPPTTAFNDWKKMRGLEEEMPETTPANKDVEEGPGWAAANTEEGRKQIEAKIVAMAEQSKKLR
jgi:hypothetical protein